MKLRILMPALLALTISATSIAQTETVVEGNNRFAFELYQELNRKDKNVFLSPYSISSALAMTYSGAKNQTAIEMEKTMHFGNDDGNFHSKFKSLMTEIESRNGDDIEVNIANRLFGDLRFKFLKSFLDGVQENYNAPLERVDFMNQLEKCRKLINKWVEGKTKDRIKELLKKGVLPDSTKLVLVNAIYFYGDWMKQFDSLATQKKDFFINGKTPAKVDMMWQQDHFQYLETNDMKAIRLPYKGNTMSMEVYLPNAKNGLDDLEENLTFENYSKWNKLFRGHEVRLSLPKFTMTTDFKLGKLLQEMGMATAFSDGADFSGMTGKRDLKISKVIHKAFVEVSEKGTEAAAATAVIMVTTDSAAPTDWIKPKKFKADHPFFFVIRDNKTKSILFMGRVNEPK